MALETKQKIQYVIMKQIHILCIFFSVDLIH